MTIDDRVSVAGLYNISLAHDSHSLRRFTHDAVTLTATDPQATETFHTYDADATQPLSSRGRWCELAIANIF